MNRMQPGDIRRMGLRFEYLKKCGSQVETYQKYIAGGRLRTIEFYRARNHEKILAGQFFEWNYPKKKICANSLLKVNT